MIYFLKIYFSVLSCFLFCFSYSAVSPNPGLPHLEAVAALHLATPYQQPPQLPPPLPNNDSQESLSLLSSDHSASTSPHPPGTMGTVSSAGSTVGGVAGGAVAVGGGSLSPSTLVADSASTAAGSPVRVKGSSSFSNLDTEDTSASDAAQTSK